MSRPAHWHPLPVAALRSLPLARLAPAHRPLWVALRLLHATDGIGGVLPADLGDPVILASVTGTLLAGVDIAAALEALEGVGLVERRPDGLALLDFDKNVESMKCARCGVRNPDPREARCPKCRASTDGEKRCAAGSEQGDDEPQDDEEPQEVTPIVTRPRQKRSRTAAEDMPATPAGGALNSESTSTSSTSTQLVQPQLPTVEVDADAETSDPVEGQKPALTGGPAAIAAAWAAGMEARGIATMTAEHDGDVAELLGQLPGGPPLAVRSAAGIAADQLAFAAQVRRWCSSPTRLAEWLAAAAPRSRNLLAYLRASSRRGDPGQLLGSAGSRLPAAHEQALAGPRRHAVAGITARLAARGAVEPAYGEEPEKRAPAPPPPAAEPSAPVFAEHPPNMPVPFRSRLYGDCQCRACQRARADAPTPDAGDDRRDLAVRAFARVVVERADPQVAADELGLELSDLEALVAEERARRPAPRVRLLPRSEGVA